MRKSSCVIAIAAVVALAACEKKAEGPTPATSSGATATTASRPMPAKPRDLAGKVVREKMPQVEFIQKSALGTKLDAAGAVAEEKKSFTAKDKIFLTMWFVQSPEGLQTSAKWEQIVSKERGASATRLVLDERKPANGQNVVTFELKKKLKPGKYRVTGYWGGNDACNYDFDVTK